MKCPRRLAISLRYRRSARERSADKACEHDRQETETWFPSSLTCYFTKASRVGPVGLYALRTTAALHQCPFAFLRPILRRYLHLREFGRKVVEYWHVAERDPPTSFTRL